MNTLYLHNPETPITNTSLHRKSIVHTVIEQTTPSLLVPKNNEKMKIKKTPMIDLNLFKKHLYKTFVLLFVKIILTEQITNLQNPLIITVVEVHYVIVIQIAILHHKIEIVLTIETDTGMSELLLLHNLTDQDLTYIDEIHVLLVHHTDLLIDHHIDEIHVLDIDHVHTLQIDHFRNIHRHIDLDHESLDLLDLDQVLKHKRKSIPLNRTIKFT